MQEIELGRGKGVGCKNVTTFLGWGEGWIIRASFKTKLLMLKLMNPVSRFLRSLQSQMQHIPGSPCLLDMFKYKSIPFLVPGWGHRIQRQRSSSVTETGLGNEIKPSSRGTMNFLRIQILWKYLCNSNHSPKFQTKLTKTPVFMCDSGKSEGGGWKEILS